MQLGVIGLGTMGANLARNAARNGARVAVYNRTKDTTDEFMKNFKSEGKFIACHSLDALVKALKPPRQILIMVKAGEPVDAVIHELTPLLQKGDVVIDAGNSHYKDTERRILETSAHGLRFIGMGVSGGEKGALEGPSMMVGGDREAWGVVEPLFVKMAAVVTGRKVNRSAGRTSQVAGPEDKCVAYIGPGGTGHFVKMVHNGIEYALMQLIAESYHLLRYLQPGLSNAKLAKTFSQWNKGDNLHSYLVEITAKILAKKEDASTHLIDRIQDVAGQKGTGKWSTQAAMDLSVAIPTITAAVDARFLSSQKNERMQAAQMMDGVSVETPAVSIDDVSAALFLSMICSYAQGMALLRKAGDTHAWNLDFSEICRIWRGGCIIRSSLLATFANVFRSTPDLSNLLVDDRLHKHFRDKRGIWASVIAKGVGAGVPIPAMSASLAYFDSYFTERLPQNLIQAQRDFFGVHGYERIDRKGTFHTEW